MDVQGLKIKTTWMSEIEDILVLLKMLPAKGRSKEGKILPFIKAVEKLIVFRKVRIFFSYLILIKST